MAAPADAADGTRLSRAGTRLGPEMNPCPLPADTCQGPRAAQGGKERQAASRRRGQSPVRVTATDSPVRVTGKGVSCPSHGNGLSCPSQVMATESPVRVAGQDSRGRIDGSGAEAPAPCARLGPARSRFPRRSWQTPSESCCRRTTEGHAMAARPRRRDAALTSSAHRGSRPHLRCPRCRLRCVHMRKAQARRGAVLGPHASQAGERRR